MYSVTSAVASETSILSSTTNVNKQYPDHQPALVPVSSVPVQPLPEMYTSEEAFQILGMIDETSEETSQLDSKYGPLQSRGSIMATSDAKEIYYITNHKTPY